MSNVLHPNIKNFRTEKAKPLTEISKKKYFNAKVWFCTLFFSIFVSLCLALTIIWVSIDSTDIAYGIGKIQQELEISHEHLAKLEVERESLLSPYVLDKHAESLGMKLAEPGQVRRIDERTSPLE